MSDTPLTDKLARAKAQLQEVLDAWPSDAGGFEDLEQAIEFVGCSQDATERVEDPERTWDA